MIHAEQLTKDYRSGQETVHAVRGIDLHVTDGEFVAILGPNGAGKSTTLRMLTTLTSPTSGRAVVAGSDVATEPANVRARIGYVGQGTAGSLNQRVVDELRVQARIHGLKGSVAGGRVAELLAAFQLGNLSRRKVSALSGGQRRRLDVAIGLVHAPRLLFLDEPSTGLDPHSRANLWDHVLRARDQYGMTIVLTTHYLEEAEALCGRIAMLKHGRIISLDTTRNLLEHVAGVRVRLRLEPDRLPQPLAGWRVGREGNSEVLQLPDYAAIEPMLGMLREGEVAVQEMEVMQADLEDVFVQMMQKS